MKVSKFSEQHIALILKQVDDGLGIDEVCRKAGATAGDVCGHASRSGARSVRDPGQSQGACLPARHGVRMADEYRAAIKRALPDGEKALGANKLAESHLDAYREMNVAIRETIFAARNRMLADAVRLTLNMPGASIRRIVSFYYDDVCRRHEGHHPIYELIVVGQGRRTEMMMREHVIGLAQSGGWSGPSPSRFSGASAIIPLALCRLRSPELCDRRVRPYHGTAPRAPSRSCPLSPV